MMNIKKHVIILFMVTAIMLTCHNENNNVKAAVIEDGFSYSKIPASIKKRITGSSYRKNPYISLKELRYVRIKHYNYKGKVKSGELIVNKAIAKDVAEIFCELYKIEYPIRRVELVDEYEADDDLSMEADNTSCFNYRSISGSKTLSMHGLGLAIDINPRINPCVGGARGIVPPNGKAYKERNVKKCTGRYKNMMIHKGDAAYKIFKEHGFEWGGEWKNMKDYQHFYKVPPKYKNCGKYEW
ncbi:MAG: M15 family metallopeptidase [Lachnospiraceae bacterium]|nr:M15 family metallopeptidase [Lachnospiraceae bacterium]